MSESPEQVTEHPDRRVPNIVITGTPGTGKTTHATQLHEALQALSVGGVEQAPGTWEHINVGDFVKEKGAHSGWNEEWQSYDVDEDKLLDELEILQVPGGKILDWHTCDIFPERWIDLVVVLRCDHTMLWSRLEKRNYSLAKIQENNTAEIMEVVLSDAQESYAAEIVVELKSESPTDVEENVARIVTWVEQWMKDHAQ